MLVQRIAIACLLFSLYFIPYILIFPIGVLLVEGIFFSVVRPYNKIRHSYRMLANNLISIAILGIYMYYACNPTEASTSQIGIYLPIAIIALLISCLIMNAAFIMHLVVKWIREKFQEDSK